MRAMPACSHACMYVFVCVCASDACMYAMYCGDVCMCVATCDAMWCDVLWCGVAQRNAMQCGVACGCVACIDVFMVVRACVYVCVRMCVVHVYVCMHAMYDMFVLYFIHVCMRVCAWMYAIRASTHARTCVCMYAVYVI